MAKIVLQRVSEFSNWLRAYTIEIDGVEVGRIRNGKRIEIHVAPGRYAMQLKIDWARSNTLEFDAAHEVVQLECGSNYRGRWLFRGVGNVLTGGAEDLWLRNKSTKDSE